MDKYYKIVEKCDFNSIGKRTTNSDFSGIYLQSSVKHAKNYLEHKANMTTRNKLLLVEFTVSSNIYELNDKIIGDYNMPSDEKANIIRKLLNDKYNLIIPYENNLIDSLDKPLKILDTLCDYELVVPHHLLNKDNFSMCMIEKIMLKEIKILNTVYKTAC